MKQLLLSLILAAGIHAASAYAGLNTEDYSRLTDSQLDEAAYNDAVAYLKAHPNTSTNDTADIGELQAHQHHLFGTPANGYNTTFFSTLDTLIKSE
jgi:hypothetical protein